MKSHVDSRPKSKEGSDENVFLSADTYTGSVVLCLKSQESHQRQLVDGSGPTYKSYAISPAREARRRKE
jgi:hypothetical protein